jgi:hypothetical protein
MNSFLLKILSEPERDSDPRLRKKEARSPLHAISEKIKKRWGIDTWESGSEDQ